MAVLSTEPDATRVPSEEKVTHLTPVECPFKVQTNAPVAECHTLTVRSFEHDASRVPSEETATEGGTEDLRTQVRRFKEGIESEMENAHRGLRKVDEDWPQGEHCIVSESDLTHN